MSESFDDLWDGTAPVGSAEVVWQTSSRLMMWATAQTTKAGVLNFKKKARGLEEKPLHAVWKALQGDGLVLENLESCFAWEVTRLAESTFLAVERTVFNVGGVTFRDHAGQVVDVPASMQQDLLTKMKEAGCRVHEVAVD